MEEARDEEGGGMDRTSFETLNGCRLPEQPADQARAIVSGREGFAKGTRGQQLVRAADGIGANIAEGQGRGTPPGNRRFVRIARGSLHETRHWLRRAHAQRLLTREPIAALQPLVDELGPRRNA